MGTIIALGLAAAVYPQLLAVVVVILTRPNPKPLLWACYLGSLCVSIGCDVAVLVAFRSRETVGNHLPDAGRRHLPDPRRDRASDRELRGQPRRHRGPGRPLRGLDEGEQDCGDWGGHRRGRRRADRPGPLEVELTGRAGPLVAVCFVGHISSDLSDTVRA